MMWELRKETAENFQISSATISVDEARSLPAT